MARVRRSKKKTKRKKRRRSRRRVQRGGLRNPFKAAFYAGAQKKLQRKNLASAWGAGVKAALLTSLGLRTSNYYKNKRDHILRDQRRRRDLWNSAEQQRLRREAPFRPKGPYPK